MNAPDKAVVFEALMKDTPGFDHYDMPELPFPSSPMEISVLRIRGMPILHYQAVHKEGDVQ
mgnify:CR=1 FL=1